MTGIFFKKRLYYGSSTGGLITLLAAILLLIYSGFVLDKIFRRQNWTIAESFYNFNDYFYQNVTFN
jgi:hypothetical protein